LSSIRKGNSYSVSRPNLENGPSLASKGQKVKVPQKPVE